jgi:hypothetical protein
MKSTEIALIIFIAGISVVVSYLVGNAVLGDPNDKVETLTYVKEIDSDVVQPDPEQFNPYSVNPTQEVYVGRCEVGQVYDNSTKKCRNFSLDDLNNPDLPDVPDIPDNPDNPDDPDNPLINPED